MTYLLDTHALIWAILQPEKLSAKVRQIIEAPEEQIMVSPVNFWEISLKFGLGKLSLEGIAPEDFPNLCQKMDIGILPLDAEICASYYRLPPIYHKDPFDRMLIWQAKNLDLTLLSKDERVRLYSSEGIRILW